MTIAEWWELTARPAGTAAAVAAWPMLNAADRKAIKAAAARARSAVGLVEQHVRDLGAHLETVIAEAELDAVIASWPSAGGLSQHLELELAASAHRGRPLEPGEPVPGCGCEACTGIPADHPVRLAAARRLAEHLAEARAKKRGGGQAWQQRVTRAKAIPITQVAALLGLGTPEGTGKEVRVRCPFHADEHPSLQLNDAKNVWFCHPCSEGGDAIGLFMKVRGLGFAAAVRDLTP